MNPKEKIYWGAILGGNATSGSMPDGVLTHDIHRVSESWPRGPVKVAHVQGGTGGHLVLATKVAPKKHPLTHTSHMFLLKALISPPRERESIARQLPSQLKRVSGPTRQKRTGERWITGVLYVWGDCKNGWQLQKEASVKCGGKGIGDRGQTRGPP